MGPDIHRRLRTWRRPRPFEKCGAIEVNIEDRQGKSTTVRGLYLPPDSRTATLHALLLHPPKPGSILIGDLNMQLHAPRNTNEAEDAKLYSNGPTTKHSMLLGHLCGHP